MIVPSTRIYLTSAMFNNYGARGRNRTGTAVKPQDFKSCVSTNFTTRAWACEEVRNYILRCAFLEALY